jgi:hypothetical protein
MIIVFFHSLALVSRISTTVLLLDSSRRARRTVFLCRSSFPLDIAVKWMSEIWLHRIFVCTGETESREEVVRACNIRGRKAYNRVTRGRRGSYIKLSAKLHLCLAVASGYSLGERSPSASKGNSSTPADFPDGLFTTSTVDIAAPPCSCCRMGTLEVLAEGASSAMSRSIPSAGPSKRGSNTPLAAVYILIFSLD